MREKFFLLSTIYEDRWSESIEPRFKIHLLDESYAWVPTTHSFTEDFGFGEEKLVREALPSLQDLRRSAARFPSGQDLKLEYSSRATRGHRNQEFSSNIRVEVREGHGSRVFRTPKSFIFAPRGREPS